MLAAAAEPEAAAKAKVAAEAAAAGGGGARRRMTRMTTRRRTGRTGIVVGGPAHPGWLAVVIIVDRLRRHQPSQQAACHQARQPGPESLRCRIRGGGCRGDHGLVNGGRTRQHDRGQPLDEQHAYLHHRSSAWGCFAVCVPEKAAARRRS